MMFQKQGNPVMRALSLAFVFSALVLLPSSLFAGNASPHHLSTATAKPANETYRGYHSSLAAVADRKDVAELAESLRQQIDILESAGLSHRVLEFFHTLPIRVDDFACVGETTAPALEQPKPIMAAACYSRIVPDSMRDKHVGAVVWGDANNSTFTDFDPVTRAEITRTGTVMVRPTALGDRNRERPVILHELLHAYHDHVLPGGFGNSAILSWFKQATEKKLYPADAYLMTNEREFFAVTASVFLFGKDGPVDRAKIKDVQPDYYKYLVWMFGLDPDRSSSGSPVASAN
jgi:hypothetical protein